MSKGYWETTNRQHTPVEIEVALHYRYATDDHKGVYCMVPAYREAAERLVAAGMLVCTNQEDEPSKPRYVKTAGLELYVTVLCCMPWPQLKWHMPDQIIFKGPTT